MVGLLGFQFVLLCLAQHLPHIGLAELGVVERHDDGRVTGNHLRHHRNRQLEVEDEVGDQRHPQGVQGERGSRF